MRSQSACESLPLLIARDWPTRAAGPMKEQRTPAEQREHMRPGSSTSFRQSPLLSNTSATQKPTNMSAPKIVYGTAGFAPDAETGEVTSVVETLNLLWDLGVKNLDTAQLYGPSEATIGKAHNPRRFTIDTKHAAGFKPATATTEGIVEHGTWASETLGPIDIYYLHAPEENIPWETQLEGLQKLHDAGVFKRLGLSNFTPEQIQKIYDVAEAKGLIKPSVFQGNYNAFARSQENNTFPLLRKLGMSFYAYSPVAGGLLAKTKEQLLSAGGRWQAGTLLGDMYRGMYGKDELLDALADWETAAKKEGVSLAELGYRWIQYHSALDGAKGDAVIFGAFSPEKIRETVSWLNKGPLSDQAVKEIDAIWEKIKDVAPVDNYNSYSKHKSAA
ncbi:Oxidoreductase sirO [Drechslerella dactyloides]|uniref:Oxidoreductase sirO n=1 Tax=Drechslerella dactyloides TaxID=74499 RepID=A0AAD6ITT6_DREDA|nr:Oxidoreductase sirO [Drechslerella dactyloides]